jgi:REP element-mobilizing transposase RayT
VLLNRLSETVRNEWSKSAQIRGEIRLDEFIVMPSHFHGIVFVTPLSRSRGDPATVGRRPIAMRGTGSRSLGSLMAGFKSATTRRYNDLCQTAGPLWQRDYYERVVRNEAELSRIRQYVRDNPLKWADDSNNPSNWPS